MHFFAASEAPPRPESMKFPVFSLLAGNLAFSETSSQPNLTFGADPIGAPVRCRSKDPPLLSGSLAIAWSAGDTANDRYPEQHGIAHPKRTVCGGEFGEPGFGCQADTA